MGTTLGALIKKELLDHLARRRFWIGMLLSIVLAALATWTAGEDYALRRDRWRERTAEAAARLERVRTYSFLRPLLVRRPEPLSVLDQGFDVRAGAEVTIDPFTIPAAAAGGHRGNEFLISFPALDMTTVVSLFLGFLALLFAHDAVTGERESGTLQRVELTGVSLRTLWLGKYLGTWLTALLLLAGCCCGAAVALGASIPTPDQGLRIAALLAAYAVYLSLLTLAGLTISTYAPSSSWALLGTFALWLGAILLLPEVSCRWVSDFGTATVLRGQAEERGARLQAELADRLAARRQADPLLRGFSGHRPSFEVSDEEERTFLYRFGSPAYYDALARYFCFASAASLESAGEIAAARRPYAARQSAEERLAADFAFLSPRGLLEHVAHAVAGTSLADQDRFLTACRVYRADLVQYFQRQGAFCSWRWFTDDPRQAARPWPTFLGTSPEQVDVKNAGFWTTRLMEPAVRAEMKRYLDAAEDDPDRRLRLEDLPRPAFPALESTAALGRALGRAAPEFAALLGANLSLAILGGRRFRRRWAEGAEGAG